MDDQDNSMKLSRDKEIDIGAGVDIVQSSEGDADDVEIESYNDDIAAGGGTMTPQDKIKALRTKLNECVKEKQSYLDGWQRLKADFANFKKRDAEEKKDFVVFARSALLEDLLPVMESFEMAFANKAAWEKVDPSWRKGVEYIHTQLIGVLADHGLKEIMPTQGETFDPSIHTSIGTIETADEKLYHRIAETVQGGFSLNGKVLKSPKVHIYGAITSDSDPTNSA